MVHKGYLKNGPPKKHARGDAQPSKEYLKPIFLEEFKKHVTINATCRAVGIARSTILRWRDVDPKFNEEFEDIDSVITETIERRAFEVATKRDNHNVHTKCKASCKKCGTKCEGKEDIVVPCALGPDNAVMIFLLKCRDKRYRPPQAFDFNITYIQQAVITIVNVVKSQLPQICPHCHGLLNLTEPILQELANIKKRLEKEGKV